MLSFLLLALAVSYARLATATFVECDLDLVEQQADILQQLPTECHQLDEASQSLMVRESLSFDRYNRKLLSYERSLGKDTDEEFYTDKEFRKELMEVTGFLSCATAHNESLVEYVDCVVGKRDDMVELIDAASAAIGR